MGKWGDLVATHGNPLDDIHQMEQVFFVMKAGVSQMKTGVNQVTQGD